MEDNRKIHLVNLTSDIVEDSYTEGLLGSTGCGYQNEKIGKTFDSVAGAVNYLAKHYGLPEGEENYEVDGTTLNTSRQCANHSEAQNGGWFEPTPQEVSAWQNGEIKLYSEEFTVNFVFTC